ncbi:MAG TPA: histidine kinase [Sphingomicrobium sp.]|nr:histidine kinase [Sphingomicrobium sp.]
MLATLFLFAIWLDSELPVHAPSATYGLLAAYIVFAAAITLLTWTGWWFDARLAGPAHAVDILTFTLLVLLTDAHVSPYFAFFMFVMLSAAIRWGWRATMLTAVLLVLLFTFAGLVDLTPGDDFEPDRFVIRAGHLVILSLILIWFGASRQWPRMALAAERELDAQPALDESPLEGGLRAAQTTLQSGRAVILWRDKGRERFAGMAIDDHAVTEMEAAQSDLGDALGGAPFLYDLPKHRALRRDAERNLVAFHPFDRIPGETASDLGLNEGLAIPLRSDDGDGIMFLERVRSLSSDHLDAGLQIGDATASHIQRHRLLRTAEENAEARSRLTLARDLHDSVVQFLAGAAFRLEAMKRSHAAGRDVDSDLNELKQLMLQEQRELRSFITSLRSGPLTAFNDLARDLQALAAHLSRQWDVRCEFQAKPADLMIPTRVRLDAHQLMREAVANAVRHAAAKSVTVEAAARTDELKLEIINDGAEFRARGGRLEMPASLKDRVEQAGGALDLARGMGVTKLSISLPLEDVGH